MDYFFIGDESKGTTPAVAARESMSKALMAHVIPGKGCDIEWTAQQLASEIDHMAYKRLVLRSDQEPAITALAEAIKQHCQTEIVLEMAPKVDKNANGHAERAVQAVEGQTRAIKFELEDRVGCEIAPDKPIVAWMVRHAADVLTKLDVKASGCTPYQVLRGRPYRGTMTDFGRQVLYFVAGRRGGDLRGRWESGIWVGKAQKSSGSEPPEARATPSATAVRAMRA